MREKRPNPDQLLARIAARQHGVVSRAQLEAAGIDKDAASRRVSAGRLHRIYRGVYAVGHIRLSFQGRCLAAALACAESAVVSHRSAATIWALLPSSPGSIEVTVPPNSSHKRRSGIVIHRSQTLEEREKTRRANVPVTKPLRTLRDLRRSYPAALAQRAQRRALDLRLVGASDLGAEPDLTRSELERQFLALCRRRRIPLPEVNVRIGPYEVDFLWREARLIVETDGFRHHGDRDAFERDRARDADLHARGYRVLRFSYRQVMESPADVAAAVRRALAKGGRRAA